jgi:hypothetical protein
MRYVADVNTYAKKRTAVWLSAHEIIGTEDERTVEIGSGPGDFGGLGLAANDGLAIPLKVAHVGAKFSGLGGG